MAPLCVWFSSLVFVAFCHLVSEATGLPLPLCTDGLLERANSSYRHDSGHLMMQNQPGCRLQLYDKHRAVDCLERLKSVRHGQPFHFFFIGDSRIRQQFLNFLTPSHIRQLIPDYDRKKRFEKHVDDGIKCPLLNGLLVSYRWRNLMDDFLVQEFTKWADQDSDDAPDYILLGVQSHHLLFQFGNNHRSFERQLRRLAPVLDRLVAQSNGTRRIVWLNQYPTVDLPNGSHDQANRQIYVEKLERYNRIARSILSQYGPKVRIWDSSNPMAEEYRRSCHLMRRQSAESLTKWTMGRFACLDYIHTGGSALMQATQIFYNDLCNDIV